MHAIRLGPSHVGYFERLIASGKATNELWPAVWIEITATPEDIVENLKDREAAKLNTVNDPFPAVEHVNEYLEA